MIIDVSEARASLPILLGSLRGRIVVPDDFADEDPEIRDMFYPAGQ